jgi:fluoroacetyl-CoA thioesterase
MVKGEKFMPDLNPGLFAVFEHKVNEDDTAAHWGSGGLHVFSTPALVGLMESAAVISLRGHLPPGKTTVGGHINVRHLAATPVGMVVRAKAQLTAVEGHKLVFSVQAWDEVELIGEAEHERFMIDEVVFMKRVESKNKA